MSNKLNLNSAVAGPPNWVKLTLIIFEWKTNKLKSNIMSSKFFGNKTVKHSGNKKGDISKFINQNKRKTTAVRKTGRGK